MDAHDYIDPNGNLRVVYGGPNVAPQVPTHCTKIGYRRVGKNAYYGTARWGRTWSEVRENTGLGPMSNPPTVND